MNATVIRREAQAIAHRPGARLAAGGLALLCLLMLAAFLVVRPRSEPVLRFAIPDTMQAQIRTMSTGGNQGLVVTGETAQERNALIAVTAEPLARMPGYAVVATDSAQYATALKCLTQAVYYEAANEPELGKRAVAQVVINRLRHPAYPKSVCGVVYEGANAAVCQFSFTCDGALLRAPMPRQWAESRKAAEEILAGQVVSEVGSATNYHADYVLPRWAFTLGKIRQIGAHIFYRFPGAFGSASVFNGRWDGVERIPLLNMARLQLAASEKQEPEQAQQVALVPGLTVTPDVKDRHADSDVGGRLDTNTGWRLSIPDPVQLSAGYRSALAGQGDPASVPAAAANIQGDAKAAN